MKSLSHLLTQLLFLLILNSTIAQNQWDIQFSQSNLNCATNQVCYQLELQNTAGTDWTLGDQNYRLFFDGDLMTVTSVTSLLPNNFYGTANIDQNIKISGQGQEAASPLDDIDNNLGFLDFSIVQTDKTNPNAATQLVWGTFTPIAEICVNVTAAAINGNAGTNCLAFYHSRPSTAGNITNQYTVISENNAAGSTTAAMGVNYDDLTSADGNQACLSLSCTPTNLPPMLQDNIAVVNEDELITIDVVATGTDPDGNIDPSTVTIITMPNNGTTTINNGTGEITYEPDPNFNGSDTLAYSICDDGIPTMCDTSTIFITVNPMSDAPIANDDTANVDENGTVNIPVLNNDTDIDGPINPANVAITDAPNNGTATVNAATGMVTYTPNSDFSGMDTLTYIICDDPMNTQFCSTAIVIITVNPQNDAPSNGNESVFTATNIALNNIDLDANNIDPEGDILTLNIPTTSTQGGVVTNNNDGTIDYMPPSGFTGEDLVIYTVCDPTPSCATDTLFIQVGGCLTIETAVWLEGAYQNGSMHTKLNDLRYLPGQDPSTFMGTETPAGQPYNQAPWSYNGTEGQAMSYQNMGVANADYPSTVVDWVLVSLRSGTAEATTACQRAGLLHSDGSITFLSGFDCCNINLAIPYYIVIEHRNHLLVMSHQPVNISGTTISYDFRNQQSYTAGGVGQNEVSTGVFVMLAANGDQSSTPAADTNIEVTDFTNWQNANGNHSGYYPQDFDLNGDVNVQDKNLWLQNKNNSSNVPN